MKTLNQYFDEQMQNDDFRKEYDAIRPELNIIRALVDARTSEGMSQKELSEKTGINQADISKIENGTRNPSLSMLQRLADGLNMTLRLEFIPKAKTKQV